MQKLTEKEIENLERFRHGWSIEVEQAAEIINHGQALPLTSCLYASIRKIKDTIVEAKKDGAEISHDAKMLICADEAKRIFKNHLSNYAHTLFKFI